MRTQCNSCAPLFPRAQTVVPRAFVYPCTFGEAACPGGARGVRGDGCAAGSEGALCLACVPGHYLASGLCYQCRSDSSDFGKLVMYNLGLLVAIAIVAAVISFLVYRTKRGHARRKNIAALKKAADELDAGRSITIPTTTAARRPGGTPPPADEGEGEDDEPQVQGQKKKMGMTKGRRAAVRTTVVGIAGLAMGGGAVAAVASLGAVVPSTNGTSAATTDGTSGGAAEGAGAVAANGAGVLATAGGGLGSLAAGGTGVLAAAGAGVSTAREAALSEFAMLMEMVRRGGREEGGVGTGPI